jgi:2-C-methyl-D-erythritol 2,4-cyclodiphosphate synthase
VVNRDLFLGGVRIDYPLGLLGHSDADVVLHAVAESIIGALGLGDLGTHFPDSDPQYHLKESSFFVIEAMNMAKKAGYAVNNIDILIYIEKPHLKDYKPKMRSNIARLLEVDESLVNVKAATMEKKGIIGEGVGIAAEAVVLLVSKK